MAKKKIVKKPAEKSEIQAAVRKAYEIMKKEDLVELEWAEKNSFKLTLRRKGAFAAAAAGGPAAGPLAEKPPADYIRSPMNGIFYTSAAPGEPPFVKENDEISAGTTVCIIEAMKLMNEVQVERGCRIIKVLVNNAEAVKVNQPIFEIEAI